MQVQKLLISLIEKWGYLNVNQISTLLNRNIGTTRIILKKMVNKGLLKEIKINKIYYLLTSKALHFTNKKTNNLLKINIGELEHLENLIIVLKSLQKKYKVLDYQTERDQKKEFKGKNLRNNKFCDLIIFTENETYYIEYERRYKDINRYKKIFSNFRSLIKENKIIYISEHQQILKKIYDIAKEYDYYFKNWYFFKINLIKKSLKELSDKDKGDKNETK